MERIARFYDDETARSSTPSAGLSALMAAGSMVGMVVVLMYMPIFELAGSIQ
jgi:general secretion pathway protein F